MNVFWFCLESGISEFLLSVWESKLAGTSLIFICSMRKPPKTSRSVIVTTREFPETSSTFIFRLRKPSKTSRRSILSTREFPETFIKNPPVWASRVLTDQTLDRTLLYHAQLPSKVIETRKTPVTNIKPDPVVC